MATAFKKPVTRAKRAVKEPPREHLAPDEIRDATLSPVSPLSSLHSPLHPGQRTAELADLARNRFNPRQEFDETEMRELAVSLRTYGMLQPVVVRPILGPVGLPSMIDAGRVAELEIVAGERRALAAKLAGIAEIPVTVIECDDARACELAIEENRRRRDISQVEFARGLKRLAELKGLTLADGRPDAARVAQDQGLSDGGARNLFRLLDAPEQWQQRVISQEISGAHLRDALPYLHVPKIEEALAKLLKDSKSDPLTERQWKDAINRVVCEHSVALSGNKWVSGGGHVEWSISDKHPQYAELDVVTVSKWGAKQKRALNAPLAKKLMSERKREKLAKLETSKKKKADGADAHGRAKAKYEKERRDRARQAVVANWTCSLIADAIRLLVHDERALLGVAAAVALHERFLGDLNYPNISRAELLTLPPQTLGNLLAQLFDVDRENPPVDEWQPQFVLPDLLALAAWLDIDHAASWRAKDGDHQRMAGPMTDDWLLTLDDAELRELADEWRLGLATAKLATMKRDELERALTENRARVMPLPKQLAAILKPPKPKKTTKKRGQKNDAFHGGNPSADSMAQR